MSLWPLCLCFVSLGARTHACMAAEPVWECRPYTRLCTGVRAHQMLHAHASAQACNCVRMHPSGLRTHAPAHRSGNMQLRVRACVKICSRSAAHCSIVVLGLAQARRFNSPAPAVLYQPAFMGPPLYSFLSCAAIPRGSVRQGGRSSICEQYSIPLLCFFYTLFEVSLLFFPGSLLHYAS